MATEYSNKTERFKSLTGEMACLYARKNRDYGDSFSDMYKEYGPVYAVMHLEEKLARIKSILLTQDGKPSVKSESAIDSLTDLACYALMTILELKEEKERQEGLVEQLQSNPSRTIYPL